MIIRYSIESLISIENVETKLFYCPIRVKTLKFD